MERLPQRQVSLNKFIRLAGDLLMPSLYSPYVQLLVNLCGHPEAALHCFNLLKLNGGLTGKSIKWIFFPFSRIPIKQLPFFVGDNNIFISFLDISNIMSS